jgi:AcrR family transcriptional regulator
MLIYTRMMMPRQHRAKRGEGSTTAAEIKTTARQQMAQHGTAGLSLRGIARTMGITAPAIYNYFPRLDDLITALIVDSFTDLADAMDTAGVAASAEPVAQIRSTVLAYRQWAVNHPLDFQLIYGNPIPGYVAPFEVTAPLARRPFLPLFGYFWQAYQSGQLTLPAEYSAVPPQVADHIKAWREHIGVAMPESLFCAVLTGWSRIHGLVMLELTHHIQPMIGYAAEFYEYEVDAFLQQLGMAITR